MADIAVTVQSDYQPPRNVITLHASAGCIFDSLEVTRLQDGIETPIRRQPVSGVSDVTVYDYEMPYGHPVSYRMSGTEQALQAMRAPGAGRFNGDAFSVHDVYAESDITTSAPRVSWLVHPGNPARSLHLPLRFIAGIGDTGRRATATRHDVLGARYPVFTVPGPRTSREFTLQLRTRTSDDERMLDALLDDQTPLLLNLLPDVSARLNMNPMYLQVLDSTDARFAQMLYGQDDSPGSMREWQLPCIEVASPAISQQAVGWTYAQLAFDFGDYLRIRTTYGSYADLQANTKRIADV